MRTRKSLLPIVVLCVTVVGLALCQEKRWSKTAAAKHRDKSTKGKYEPDYADGTREEEEEQEEAIDENSKELYHDRGAAATSDYHVLRFIDELAAFRNNRAIGSSRYIQRIPLSVVIGEETIRVPRLRILLKPRARELLIAARFPTLRGANFTIFFSDFYKSFVSTRAKNDGLCAHRSLIFLGFVDCVKIVRDYDFVVAFLSHLSQVICPRLRCRTSR